MKCREIFCQALILDKGTAKDLRAREVKFFGKKSAFLVVLWLAAFIAFTSIHSHTDNHAGQITQQCQMCSFENQAQGSIEAPQQAFIPYNPVLSPVIATQDFFTLHFICSPRNSRAPPLV